MRCDRPPGRVWSPWRDRSIPPTGCASTRWWPRPVSARRPWWDWSDDPADRAAVLSALERVKLGAFAERPVGSLSSGERQRAVIALAIAQETQVVLFDEPTSHLDVRVALEVLSLLHALARSGCAVVAVLHDLNQAAMIADRIALLGCGRMLAYAKPAECWPRRCSTRPTAEFIRLDADGHIRVVADGFRT